ncbi:Glycoside Hydrolase Family 12 protein [Tuber magnatum]|uniref:Glycoside Hydrolase Family 12 protein n=1 Tax=Tuber magnatum TaxID=42249 RepID=A0A317SFW5_9PEZI|nr:Glycoside Hydrolase Family 12 protein [Tuber magnatum]
MKFSVVASALLSACVALAEDFCGQYASVNTFNNYIIYNNLWGMGSATSGSQCTGLDSASGKKVAWHTTWSWAGGEHDVKSFANANLIFTPKTVADIRSIKSTMKYSYNGIDGAVANVAYDIFTAPIAGSSSSEYEVMIWLAAYGGAGPISSTGRSIDTPTIAGLQWKLYDGYNSAMHVYSFVAVDSPLTRFSCDVKLFLTYLADNHGFPTSQYVNTLQAGTEPFTAAEPFTGSDAELTVSEFSAVVA